MAESTESTPPAKSRLTGLLVFVLLGLLAVAGGFSLPLLLSPEGAHNPPAKQEAKRPALVPFGDVIVNLSEERLTRYLRVKMMLVVEESDHKKVEETLQKQKAFLKSWLISYLSDLSMQEVAGAAGVNRVRREIRDQFNAMLYPDGAELIQDILFDEFVVQ